jgi:hypothetical protein
VTRKVAREKGIMGGHESGEQALKWTHHVIKFVSDLRQGDGFLKVIRYPPPIKLTAMI